MTVDEKSCIEVLDPVWGTPVDTETTPFRAERWGATYYFVDAEQRRKFLEGPRVAYFSMEIELRSDIPTYSGGLGVLAGDTIRSASDLHIPMVAVSLVNRMGYFRQELTATGEQIAHSDPWDPATVARSLSEIVKVQWALGRSRSRPGCTTIRPRLARSRQSSFWIPTWMGTRTRSGRSPPSSTAATTSTGSSRRWCSASGACACSTPWTSQS